MRIIGAIALALATIMFLPPSGVLAADRSIEIMDFSVYPDDNHNFNKLGGYTWPNVKELNALIEVKLDGFRGEQKLDVFLVVYDENDRVVYKEKAKHYLPTGEHDVVFARFMKTNDYFGRQSFKLEVEVDMKGVKAKKAQTGFSLEGPDEPDVDIFQIGIFHLEDQRFSTHFKPGEVIVIDAQIEIEDNESEVEPTITLYCAMEEDSFNIGPEFEYQEFDAQWDSRKMDSGNGLFKVKAAGFLPYFFEESWQYYHPFRVYLTVDYGFGVETTDYASATIYDTNSGNNRYSDDTSDRLIRLERATSWLVKRIRGGRPGQKYWRDK